MVDKIIKGKTRTKRIFCSYYTSSDPILNYMVRMLDVQKNDEILEPCAGDGMFIDKILSIGNPRRVDALDLNHQAVETLIKKYEYLNSIHVRHTDTLIDDELDLLEQNKRYTKVIGNPPYGAWITLEDRKFFSKKYQDYGRETYTLFLRRCINLLKDNGRLVFIIPDTFLAITLHKGIRRLLVNETTIEEIILMPSNFFPDVNFGYSNLSIITIVKKKPHKSHRIRIAHVSEDVEQLDQLASGVYTNADRVEYINQNDVKRGANYSFHIKSTPKIRSLLWSDDKRLGDIADCVTGFCSGDNRAFYIDSDKEHPIEHRPYNYTSILDGLADNDAYIPIIRGRSQAFFPVPNTFVKWSTAAVDHYKTNRKSRFQNSTYYFRDGIGVPMVKTKKLKAFHLQRQLFDQSVVGIFPHDPDLLDYLLVFLNSDIANTLIKAINHTSNNSAGYLKQLPIRLHPDDLKLSKLIVETISNEKEIDDVLMNRFNNQVNSRYAL